MLLQDSTWSTFTSAKKVKGVEVLKLERKRKKVLKKKNRKQDTTITEGNRHQSEFEDIAAGKDNRNRVGGGEVPGLWDANAQREGKTEVMF